VGVAEAICASEDGADIPCRADVIQQYRVIAFLGRSLEEKMFGLSNQALAEDDACLSHTGGATFGRRFSYYREWIT